MNFSFYKRYFYRALHRLFFGTNAKNPRFETKLKMSKLSQRKVVREKYLDRLRSWSSRITGV